MFALYAGMDGSYCFQFETPPPSGLANFAFRQINLEDEAREETSNHQNVKRGPAYRYKRFDVTQSDLPIL